MHLNKDSDKKKYRISIKHNYPFIFQPGEEYFIINQIDQSMEEYRLWDGQWYRNHSTLGLAELALSSAFHSWLLMVAAPAPQKKTITVMVPLGRNSSLEIGACIVEHLN